MKWVKPCYNVKVELYCMQKFYHEKPSGHFTTNWTKNNCNYHPIENNHVNDKGIPGWKWYVAHAYSPLKNKITNVSAEKSQITFKWDDKVENLKLNEHFKDAMEFKNSHSNAYKIKMYSSVILFKLFSNSLRSNENNLIYFR